MPNLLYRLKTGTVASGSRMWPSGWITSDRGPARETPTLMSLSARRLVAKITKRGIPTSAESAERNIAGNNMTTPSIKTQTEDEGPSTEPNPNNPDNQSMEGGGLQMPSIDRKVLLILAALALVVALVVWKRRAGGQSSKTTTEEADEEANKDEIEPRGGEIDVPDGGGDPLAGDEAVTEEFRDRGVLSDPED